MKHYQPLVRYEEEEQAVADNLDTFPVLEWQEISPLTEHQRSMMRLPFLGTYLFNWHDHERKAVELLEQNLPLQKMLQHIVSLYLNQAQSSLSIFNRPNRIKLTAKKFTTEYSIGVGSRDFCEKPTSCCLAFCAFSA